MVVLLDKVSYILQNEIFNDAAMSAVVAATPYKNPTGEDIDIKVPVEFRGHESSDDEEE